MHSLFFREFRRSFHTTGAILPSGRALGRALTRFLGAAEGPRRILEVGPGTGAVTRWIVSALAPDDRLDLVEINAAFADHLRELFANDPHFSQRAGQVRILHENIVDWKPEATYDRIISGLPLNNFSVDDVERILAALEGLAHAGTVLSFFEYMAVRSARSLVSGSSERERLRGIGRSLARVLQRHEIARDGVWRNVPPAWVHHLRFDHPSPGREGSSSAGRDSAPSDPA